MIIVFDYNIINIIIVLYFNSLSINRKCIKTTTLDGDLTIPRGAIVIFTFYWLHHDPKYWNDPEKFNPNRLVLQVEYLCIYHNIVCSLMRYKFVLLVSILFKVHS